jgi:ABC-type transport system involved in cytochrome c biogenesis permease subunit
VLAVFYLYGYLHHRKWAWGIFVLPLVLGLVVLAAIDPGPQSSIAWLSFLDALPQDQVWRILHYGLLILASVGVCVGFLASVMYLFQAHRLKAKLPPGQGIRLPSLERLEEMNQRAINLAFPLLTAGVAIGLLVMPNQALAVPELTDPKILGTAVLWGLFVLLLVLRYAARVRGRRMALLTILAFFLLLLTLASSHTSVQGGAQ